MRKWERILGVVCLTILASVVGVVTVRAAAAEVGDVETGTLGENLSWSLTKDGVLTISGEGPMLEGEHGYITDASYSIKEVIIEEGVTTISDNAFGYMEELNKITLPSGIIKIGDFAFYVCRELKEIVIPEGTISIGDQAFRDCYNLQKIILPESLKSIGIGAFENCGLVDITLPSGLETLGEAIFRNCWLTSIFVSSANKVYKSIDGVLFTKDMSTLVYYPIGNPRESYTIPNVANIDTWAFFNAQNLREITISNGVKDIDGWIFARCFSLENITLPKSIEKIAGDEVFNECFRLHSIYFKGNVPEFESDSIFDGMTLNIYYPENNATWTEEVRSRDYGGTLTWKTWEPILTGEGDANGDGKVTMTDLLMCLHHVSGRTVLTGNAFSESDVNGDGKVMMVDLLRILHFVSGRNKEL